MSNTCDVSIKLYDVLINLANIFNAIKVENYIRFATYQTRCLVV